jgi:hypothetical protein
MNGMETTLEKISRLKARLDALRVADSAFQAFGAGYHQYQTGTPMTDEEVLAFEERHAIVLPEEYRTFLLTVEREGAGPYYGLYPPTSYSYELENVKSNFLSLPFPHEEPWEVAEDTLDQSALDEEHQYFGNYWVQGAMRLCHFGCGAYCILVVTGQARGQIWLDDRSSDGGIFPLANDFLTWYEQWLERSFTELKKLQTRQPTRHSRIFDKNGRPI